MKFISLLLLITLSCNSVKKSVSTQRMAHDSVGLKSAIAANTIKKDDINVEDRKLAIAKLSENDYSKTTIIKEYFTDEFALRTSDSLNQVNFEIEKKPHKEKQLLREITILETGKLTMKTDTKIENKKKRQVSTADSSLNLVSEISKTNKLIEQSEKNTTKVKAFSGWLLFAIVGSTLLFIFLYCKRKWNSN